MVAPLAAAAARHRAPPDLAPGTACASARPPGSRARPRARSRYLRRPPPKPARCRRRGPGPAGALLPTVPDRSGRPLGPGQLDLLLCAARHAVLPLPESPASAPSILHVISGHDTRRSRTPWLSIGPLSQFQSNRTSAPMRTLAIGAERPDDPPTASAHRPGPRQAPNGAAGRKLRFARCCLFWR